MKESMTTYLWSKSCRVKSRINLLFSSSKTLNVEILEIEEEEAISLVEER